MTHSAIQPEAASDIGKMRALKDFWFYFSVNRGAVIGLYVLSRLFWWRYLLRSLRRTILQNSSASS